MSDNLLIFSVYDRVAGSFSEPFVSPKKELAIRKFNYVMQSAPMVASDCDLYHIGYLDCDTGEITPVKPEFVLRYEVNK